MKQLKWQTLTKALLKSIPITLSMESITDSIKQNIPLWLHITTKNNWHISLAVKRARRKSNGGRPRMGCVEDIAHIFWIKIVDYKAKSSNSLKIHYALTFENIFVTNFYTPKPWPVVSPLKIVPGQFYRTVTHCKKRLGKAYGKYLKILL